MNLLSEGRVGGVDTCEHRLDREAVGHGQGRGGHEERAALVVGQLAVAVVAAVGLVIEVHHR